jgi:hypothetical protein
VFYVGTNKSNVLQRLRLQVFGVTSHPDRVAVALVKPLPELKEVRGVLGHP